MALPEGELTTLPANQKMTTYATGIFSVQDMDDFGLLRMAEYWQVPLGEHIIMVHMPGRQGYRYQFFNATTLQRVQKGWLLFGKEPKPTLAITLFSEIGEAFVNQQNRYLFGGDKELKGVKRTVFLSFAGRKIKSSTRPSFIASLVRPTSEREFILRRMFFR